jgi:5-formyltetrahydrofolate cyclo-ligase
VNSSLEEQKRLIRRELKTHSTRLDQCERVSLGAQASNQLLNAPWFSRIKFILGYVPLQDEVEMDLFSLGSKPLALPRFDKSTGVYCAAILTGQIKDLPRGQFGIPEPPAGAACIPLNALDLVLVPGVAFDRAGRRLGRGLGFYDRLLAEVPGVKCGVAYDWQILSELPAEPHDMSVDFIVTPTQFFATGTRVDLT